MAEQTNPNCFEPPTNPVEPEKGKAEGPAGTDQNPTKTPEDVETDAEIEDRFEATDN